MKKLKTMKMMQYVVSLIHLILQCVYFVMWNNRMADLGVQANNVKKIDIDALNISSTNIVMTQESFVFLGLAILTFAFYHTISVHLSLWISENNMDIYMKTREINSIAGVIDEHRAKRAKEE